MTNEVTNSIPAPKPVLDYGKAEQQSLWRWFVVSPLTGGGLTTALGLIGIWLDQQHPNRGRFLVVPLFLSTVWYLFLRADDLIRLACSLIAFFALVYMMSGNVSRLVFARVYGWSSREAFGNAETFILIGAIGTFALIDAVEFVIRRYKLNQRSAAAMKLVTS